MIKYFLKAIEKTRKEQDEKNKKKKLYQAKEKRNPSSASNPEDFLPLEETLFDQSGKAADGGERWQH